MKREPVQSIHLALAQRPVHQMREGVAHVAIDSVARESFVALVFNGISHVVMCASPTDLADFALGFALSEGILRQRTELYECDIKHLSEHALEVQLQISGERFAALKERRRNLTGRSGCGLCGTESLADAMRMPPPVTSAAQFTAGAIESGLQQMAALQVLQHASGGTHACGWLAADGTVQTVREDVGRHNAMDKLIGALAAQNIDFSSGAILITSRASLEMVQKSATVGVGMLVAISAPTDTAIAMAEHCGLSLIAFARGRSLSVYSRADRLVR